MADGSGVSGARYRAFISYSHRDAVFAARLHRRLEGYVLPKRLGAGRRLTPIFKDREELPAAHDLSAQVRAALAASDCLIVVCSPDAAASPWVGREIALFRELHPERPILAALIRGEPAEAFPPALAAGGVEPLAADFRKGADGERLALLKLVAGIAGVGVDELAQRDAQRRLRSVMAVTAVAVAGMLAMGGMTAFAFSARIEAESQREEAKGLVTFMLTDLRYELEAVGRLDIQTAVNERALSYYDKQNLATMPAGSKLQYAEILHAMGADSATRGDLALASARFASAERITAPLLAKAPRDPQRLKAHGQTAYWLGYVAYRKTQAHSAKTFWTEYLGLSRRASASRPGDVDLYREVGFAEGNLCSLAIELEKDASTALRTCRASLNIIADAARRTAPSTKLSVGVANRHGWMADAEELAGNFSNARSERIRQEAILDDVLAADPSNMQALDNWVGAQRGLARIAFRLGDIQEAIRRMIVVQRTLTSMTRKDPENVMWRRYLVRADQEMKFLNTQPQ